MSNSVGRMRQMHTTTRTTNVLGELPSNTANWNPHEARREQWFLMVRLWSFRNDCGSNCDVFKIDVLDRRLSLNECFNDSDIICASAYIPVNSIKVPVRRVRMWNSVEFRRIPYMAPCLMFFFLGGGAARKWPYTFVCSLTAPFTFSSSLTVPLLYSCDCLSILFCSSIIANNRSHYFPI